MAVSGENEDSSRDLFSRLYEVPSPNPTTAGDDDDDDIFALVAMRVMQSVCSLTALVGTSSDSSGKDSDIDGFALVLTDDDDDPLVHWGACSSSSSDCQSAPLSV